MQPFSPEIEYRLQKWLTGSYDETIKSTLRMWMEKDPQKIIDAFYSDLSFGTGGLRAVMGIGSAKLNEYTIQMATQGLASYLLEEVNGPISVTIGYDNRHNSYFFAEKAASVLAANGITVYLFTELRPTPFVSFACRFKGCSAAIMITASHNPPEYNGYKVYWSYGGQVVSPHDSGILDEIKKVKHFSDVKRADLDSPLIHRIGEDFDEEYIRAIHPLQNQAQQNKKRGGELKIVYTSLHGTGITLIPKALSSWGFSSIYFVENQVIPDPEFRNAKNPNPEAKEALALGIDLLEEIHADIVIGTDPDADRIGIAVSHQNKVHLLNGNEVAAICVEYLLSTQKKQNLLSKKAGLISTIVTTDLLAVISKAYGAFYFEVLTGFKYIGELMEKWSKNHSYDFLFGAEESYGYLLGTHARDKDAIVSACLLSEIALDAKCKNLTLVDLLENIYKKYGVYREKQISISCSNGKEGIEEIAKIMLLLRKTRMKKFLGKTVAVVEDFHLQKGYNVLTQNEYALTLPQSDVLLIRFDDNSKLVIRPSGTEPKLKIYGFLQKKSSEDIEKQIQICDQKLENLLKSCQNHLLSLIKAQP